MQARGAIFVYPDYSEQQLYTKFKKASGVCYHFGLSLLSAYLKSKRPGIQVRIIDGQIAPITRECLAEAMREISPALVGVTATTPVIGAALRIASLVKEIDPEMPVVFGGPHATLLPQELLEQNSAVDFAVIGEGERPLDALVGCIEQGGGYADCPGLAWRSDGQVVVNGPCELIMDLDTLPFPDYEGYSPANYTLPIHKYSVPNTFSLVTSRGCPYRCGFCSTRLLSPRHRSFSPERTIEEIRYLKREFGAQGIMFQDSLFTAPRDKIEGFCRMAIKEKLGIQWSANARANNIDADLVALMKESGCWALAFGVESGNQEMLDRMQKTLTLEEIEEAVRFIKAAGIQTRASYIFGFPGETAESARDTYRFAKRLATNMATFHYAMPLPGTDLDRLYIEEYGHREFRWEDLGLLNDQPVFIPPTISREDLVYYYTKAWRTYYLTPAVVLENLRAIRSPTDIKRYLIGFRSIFLGK